MITEQTITLTREEAEQAFNAIQHAMTVNVETQKAIQRKKWRPAEKAMACVPYVKRWDALNLLRKKIGAAFSIGGY